MTTKEINQITIPISVTTRTCTTLLDKSNGKSTEIIEPSGKLIDAEVNSMMNLLKDTIKLYDGIAMCGTFPPGITSDIYHQIASGKSDNAIVLLDAYKDVTHVLSSGKVSNYYLLIIAF